MFFGRLIGFLLLLLSVIVLIRDVLAWYDTGKLVLMTGSQLWFTLNPDQYESAEGWMRDSVPTLWDLVLSYIFGWPAFIVSAVFAAIFLYVFRSRVNERDRVKARRRRRRA